VKARQQITELKELQNANRAGSDVTKFLENTRKSNSSITDRSAEITGANAVTTTANAGIIAGAKAFNVNSKDEERQMKTEIDLGDHAESRGWTYDPKHSGSVSKQYEKEGTKIVVAKSMTGEYLYWERGTSKGGSILDFEMQYGGASNLGFAKKAVRNLIGKVIAPHIYAGQAARPKLRKSTPDTQKITNLWNELPEYNQPYLRGRGISLETEKKFDVREDAHGNACFKYQSIYGSDAFGIEKRGEETRLFEKGSKKELWIGKVGEGKKTIIFTESPIDAISYEQLNGYKIEGQRIYIATGGQMKKELIADIEKMMASSHYTSAKLIMAHDNDTAGHGYSEAIQAIVKQDIERCIPLNKDWNEDLVAEIAKQKAIQNKAQSKDQLEAEKLKL
jgi:hypothetical protein